MRRRSNSGQVDLGAHPFIQPASPDCPGARNTSFALPGNGSGRGRRAAGPEGAPIRLIPRLVDVAAGLGWRRAIALGPRWLVERRYLVLTSDIPNCPPPPAPPPGVRVTLASEADLPVIATLQAGLAPAAAARRLREGQECLLGWWNDELVHCRWDSTRPVYLPYLGRVLRPFPGDLITVDLYTSPRARGHGVASAAMGVALARARAASAVRGVWLAASWNRGSLGLAAQVAGRVVGTVGYRGIWRARRYFATGQVRFDADGSLHVDPE
jgi:GNAT superfamily N-acetyltransferase